MRLEGLDQVKKPMTLSGIEPATFQKMHLDKGRIVLFYQIWYVFVNLAIFQEIFKPLKFRIVDIVTCTL
jgi:hypothetical protein